VTLLHFSVAFIGGEKDPENCGSFTGKVVASPSEQSHRIHVIHDATRRDALASLSSTALVSFESHQYVDPQG
jgi:hypothetical protein